jgi:hypothetical protein
MIVRSQAVSSSGNRGLRQLAVPSTWVNPDVAVNLYPGRFSFLGCHLGSSVCGRCNNCKNTGTHLRPAHR